MSYTRGFLSLAPKLVLAAGLSSVVMGCAWVNRVSVTPIAGVEPNGHSQDPSASQTGRYIAFASEADNLVAGDTNSYKDIFVRDNQTGTTELISASIFGGSANGISGQPDISANGRYVVFWSFGDDLIASDTNLQSDVFLHDRQTGITERVSVATGGAEAVGASLGGSVSDDGRYIVFYSTAALALNDTNASFDIYKHDRTVGTTWLISKNLAGDAAGSSFDPVIARNGQAVIFWSNASGMLGSNGYAHVFSDSILLPAVLNLTYGGNGNSYTGDLGGGSTPTIAFVSSADNLLPGDTNGVADIFVIVWDGFGSITRRITDGDAASSNPVISESLNSPSTTVAFTSAASNLQEPGAQPLDTNGYTDVYLWKLNGASTGGTTRLMSQTVFATSTNGSSYRQPALSSNGAAIAYGTFATNLGPDDTNGFEDLYVRPIHVPDISSVSGSLAVGQTSVLTLTGSFQPGTDSDSALLFGDGVASVTVDSVSYDAITITVELTPAATPGSRQLWVYNPATELGIPAPFGSGDFELVAVDP